MSDGGEGLKNMFSDIFTEGSGSISGFVRNSLTVVTITVLLFGTVLYFLQDIKEKERTSREVQASAEGVAHSLSGQVQLYRALLQLLAADPELAEIFRSGGRGVLLAQEEVLAGQIPQASRVHLLSSGWDSLGGEQERQLSFATLDMLRTVGRSGQISMAEVHQLKEARPHVAMAMPVKEVGSGRVLGIIHLILPLTMLEQSLQAVNRSDAQVELRQLAEGESVVLVANEKGGHIDGQGSGSFPVPNSIWKVVFQPPKVGSLPDLNPTMLIVPMLGLLLVGLLMLLQMHRLKGMLQVDHATIVKMVERGLHGHPVKREQSRLLELQPTMDRLVYMAHHVDPALGQQAVVAESSSVEEQITVTETLAVAAAPKSSPAMKNVPTSIFRAYDIRGVAGSELSPELVFNLGRAIGSEAGAQGEQSIIIARDGRISSPDIVAELCRGLMASGRDVVDIGVVPTPVLYFATYFLGSDSGVMVTGSHNPADYNGFKIVINGKALSGDEIQGLRKRIESGDFSEGRGRRQEQDLVPDYMGRIAEDVQLSKPLKVVVDCGNGVAGVLAPALLKAMGCEVVELFCEVNGNFPNHHPDPGKLENLQDLIATVKSEQADVGVAFDGDGDRLGVVDSSGKIIWPDRLLILLAADVLSRHPGADIIYDVKSTRHLAAAILGSGGRPLMWKTGHSLIKAKLRESGAMLAGEMSGHIFFQERWYGFDDGVYAAARLLEILSIDARSSAEVFAEIPESPSTPELNMPVADDAKFPLLQKLRADGGIPGAKLITIDGIRAEFEYGWGLVRASNTTPSMVFRFEADSEVELQKIQQLFRERLLAIDANLKLPF